MSLNSELMRIRRHGMTTEVSAAYDELLAVAQQSGVAEHALGVGARMPGFLLPNEAGRLIASEMLLERGPLVLTFFRGHWCPYCTAMLAALEACLPEISAERATLVALTPETGGLGFASATARPLHYEILIDVDNLVGLQFGVVIRMPERLRRLMLQGGLDLVARQGNPGWLMPIPSTYIVGQDGIIRFVHCSTDFTRQRIEPEDIVAFLKQLPR